MQFIAADGTRLNLPSVTQREVLASVALDAGATVRPDVLCDRLNLSAGALRTTVSRLRGRVGAEVIATDATGYRLTCDTDAGVVKELVAFRHHAADRIHMLRAALALWNGPALEEFRHEEWGEAWAARFDELHDQAVEELVATEIDCGRAADSVAVIEEHAIRHPLRDRARGLQIRALAGVGRQADALRAYHDYRQRLAEETGTEPSPEVKKIEQLVALGWDGCGGHSGGRSTAGAPFDSGVRSHLVRVHDAIADTRTVDRPLQRAGLEGALLEVAACSEGQSVLVTGEAGIGKTTLVAHFAREVTSRSRASVIRLASDPTAPDPGEFAREVDRVAREQPLVVIIEDLHRATSIALDGLRRLRSRIASLPVMVIATCRDHLATTRCELDDMLAHSARSVRIEVGGFDDNQLVTLVQRHLGTVVRPPADLIAALRDQSAGHAAYATQLLTAAVNAGILTCSGQDINLLSPIERLPLSAELGSMIAERVDELGSRTTAVLQAASLLAPPFNPAFLAEVSGLPAAEVDEALSFGIHAGLLIEDDAADLPLRFVHGVVARSLSSGLGRESKRRYHTRAADAIERHGGPLSLETATQMAHHRSLAGESVAAQRWARLAADLAMSELTFAEATRWYRSSRGIVADTARGESDAAAMFAALGTTQVHVGRLSTSSTTLADVVSLAVQSGSGTRFGDAIHRAALSTRPSSDPLVQFLWSRSRYQAAIEAADPRLARISLMRMRSIASVVRDPRLVWIVGIADTFEATMAGRLDEADQLAARTRSIGVGIGEPDALGVYGEQVVALRSFGDSDAEVVALLEELSRDAPHPGVVSLALAFRDAAAGRGEAARVLLEHLPDLVASGANDMGQLTATVGYAHLALTLQHVEAASVLYDTLLPHAGRVDFDAIMSFGPVDLTLGRLARMLGDDERAIVHLRDAASTARRCGWVLHEALARDALAETARPTATAGRL